LSSRARPLIPPPLFPPAKPPRAHKDESKRWIDPAAKIKRDKSARRAELASSSITISLPPPSPLLNTRAQEATEKHFDASGKCGASCNRCSSLSPKIHCKVLGPADIRKTKHPGSIVSRSSAAAPVHVGRRVGGGGGRREFETGPPSGSLLSAPRRNGRKPLAISKTSCRYLQHPGDWVRTSGEARGDIHVRRIEHQLRPRVRGASTGSRVLLLHVGRTQAGTYSGNSTSRRRED
jgi:hypothetical protein